MAQDPAGTSAAIAARNKEDQLESRLEEALNNLQQSALHERGLDALAENVMRRDFLLLDANEMLETALAKMHAAECCTTAPVMQRDTMIGLLTAENVSELLLTVSALGERRPQNRTLRLQ